MKYISKFTYEKTFGYQVRLPEMVKGKYLKYAGSNHFFRRTAYKSWKACLADAVIWRDKALKKMGGLYTLDQKHAGRIDIGMKNSGRNTSGAIGITLACDIRPSGDYYGYKAQWCVTVRGKRKQLGKQFSCDLYGEDQAFLYACRVRFKHRGTIIITDIKAIPCLPDVEYHIA